MYVVKHEPEDFVVEEIGGTGFKEHGRFLIVKVTKRLRNTEDAAQILSRGLRIPRKDVGYAGAKDRNAVTTQRFSLKNVTAERLVAAAFGDLVVEPLGYLDEPLGLGALEGNRFTIVVRNLEGGEDLALPVSVPNYYDEQRFGSGNAAIGEALLRKRFADALALIVASTPREAARVSEYEDGHPGDAVGALLRLPRQLLRMYLHSYQSLLWNRGLAEYVRTAAKDTSVVPYSQGEFLFPERTASIPDASIPIPGFGFSGNDYTATGGTEKNGNENALHDRLIERILEQEDLAPRDFVIRQLPNLSLEGGNRDALIAVKDFSVSAFADDDRFPGKKRATLRFSLPKGSYATVVVKAIMGR